MATMTEGPHHTPNMPGSGHHHHQQQQQQQQQQPQQHQSQHHNSHVHDDDTMNGSSPSAPARIVPIPTPTIHTSAPPGEPMDITTPTTAAPMSARSPEPAHEEFQSTAAPAQNSHPAPAPSQNGSAPTQMPAPSAAAAVAQPKIVQTAFIHKLYSMLEDPMIQNLISWTPAGDSFVMTPTSEFSRVLSQYFKHTNISSFVRQLNMYGFHKVVSDVFHSTTPESSMWEFRHGNLSFRRGDLTSLRDIKRRASRHALVNRDYNGPKPAASQPSTPAESIHMTHGPSYDNTDARLSHLEHTLCDITARLQRSDEYAHQVYARNQAMYSSMNRTFHHTSELCRYVMALAAPDSPMYRDVSALQVDIQRQIDQFRDEAPEQPPSRQYLSHIENATPVSPRQLAQDDPRRSNLVVPQPRSAVNNYRPQISSGLAVSTRRQYGSIGGGGSQASPLRSHQQLPIPPPPPPIPQQQPLSAADGPNNNLLRRHTTADIRIHWNQSAPSPFVPGPSQNPGPQQQWSPSFPPHAQQQPPHPEEQRIRDSFLSYDFQAASRPRSSRPTSPALPPFSASNNPPASDFNGWSFNSAMRGEAKGLGLRDLSAPSTRRGSMAHILNPSDTAERDDEDEDPRGEEDRKRKRMA